MAVLDDASITPLFNFNKKKIELQCSALHYNENIIDYTKQENIYISYT